MCGLLRPPQFGGARRLDAIPGVGPVLATALVGSVADPRVFRSGRNFSAWIGLVPKQHSSGGKDRLGGISKQGDRYTPWYFALAATVARASDNVLAALHLPERNPCKPLVGLNAMKCFEATGDLINAMAYIVGHTAPDEMIFVGAGRHDKLFVNDVIFYFIVRRNSITKWHQLHPGVQTTARIQAQMISEFRQRKPRYLVLNSLWDTAREPNGSALSSGVTILDDFIRQNYRLVASFGPISIMKADGDPG